MTHGETGKTPDYNNIRSLEVVQTPQSGKDENIRVPLETCSVHQDQKEMCSG